ncbi:MAG: GTPase RsgA, partial [Flavobacteriales bacterium]|nr:GTPase RsgA [Flavobacteriales bacterium]
MTNTVKGTVIRSTGNWNTVLLEDELVCECNLRGRFRIKGLRTTNPVTVGDNVEIIKDEANPKVGVIVNILPRKNYVIRKSVNLSKEAHIIASNLDQAIVIATVEQPRTSFGFIDRVLCTTEAYKIPSAVVINKSDIYTSKESKELLKTYIETYERIGYRTFV